jgi:hypothetical protein
MKQEREIADTLPDTMRCVLQATSHEAFDMCDLREAITSVPSTPHSSPVCFQAAESAPLASGSAVAALALGSAVDTRSNAAFYRQQARDVLIRAMKNTMLRAPDTPVLDSLLNRPLDKTLDKAHDDMARDDMAHGVSLLLTHSLTHRRALEQLWSELAYMVDEMSKPQHSERYNEAAVCVLMASALHSQPKLRTAQAAVRSSMTCCFARCTMSCTVCLLFFVAPKSTCKPPERAVCVQFATDIKVSVEKEYATALASAESKGVLNFPSLSDYERSVRANITEMVLRAPRITTTIDRVLMNAGK